MSGRPEAGEYAPFYAGYVAQVPEEGVLEALAEELALLREGNLALFRRLPEEAWMRTGNANGQDVSVRALAFILAGHLRHHLAVLAERYGVS